MKHVPAKTIAEALGHKPFAVIVYVEAADAVEAVSRACDVMVSEEAAQRAAALCDGIKVRPATRRERQA